MKKKLFLHVQHLLGIGHFKRVQAIAEAAAKRGMEILLVSGGAPIEKIFSPGITFFQLPPARAADASFSSILGETGKTVDDDWKDHRRQQLLKAFADFGPDMVLVEMFPFGRRFFRFELLPLLEAAKASDLPIFCSVRDVLVTKDKLDRQWETVKIIETFFDGVLVHGDPNLVAFNFPLSDQIAPKIHYTGYIGPAIEPGIGAREDASGEVLVSAGGGAVGFPLLKEALLAKPKTKLAKYPWRFIAGLNLDEDSFRWLQEHLDPGDCLDRYRTDFLDLLARCRLSISQGGYNTILEILQARCPALVVPFAEQGENEQELRARLLAQKGYLEYLPSGQWGELAQAIDRACALTPLKHAIDMQGADRSVAYLEEWMRGKLG